MMHSEQRAALEGLARGKGVNRNQSKMMRGQRSGPRVSSKANKRTCPGAYGQLGSARDEQKSHGVQFQSLGEQELPTSRGHSACGTLTQQGFLGFAMNPFKSQCQTMVWISRPAKRTLSFKPHLGLVVSHFETSRWLVKVAYEWFILFYF